MAANFSPFLLKPLNIEVRAANAQTLRDRKQHLRALYDGEMDSARSELKRMRISKMVHKARFRSTPLGMVPNVQQYLNQIKG